MKQLLSKYCISRYFLISSHIAYPLFTKLRAFHFQDEDKGKRYLDVSNRVKRPPRLRSYKGDPVSPSASKRPMSTPVTAEASNQESIFLTCGEFCMSM